jgi:hypothetical protein
LQKTDTYSWHFADSESAHIATDGGGGGLTRTRNDEVEGRTEEEANDVNDLGQQGAAVEEDGDDERQDHRKQVGHAVGGDLVLCGVVVVLAVSLSPNVARRART